MNPRQSFLSRVTLLLLFSVLFVYVLTVGKQILYPIVMAILFSYFIFPVVNFFEKKLRFPKALSAFTGILLSGAFIYGVGSLIASQIKVFTADFPVLKEHAIANIDSFQNFISEKFGFAIDEQEVWIKEKIDAFFESSGKTLQNIITHAAVTLEALIFIPIFSFFMLSYRERGKNFIFQLAKKQNGELTEKLLNQISKVTVKYVTGVLIVVFILAISHSVALSIIGVKYAIILGIMSALISIIPYFGTFVSGLVPFLITAVTMNNPYILLFIVIYYWAIIIIDHNILTPMIVGGNVSLNPLITILGIIIAANIWAIPGMIVIVPILAIIKIICDNVERLKPWGYLLGDNQHGMSFDKIKKIFTKK